MGHHHSELGNDQSKAYSIVNRRDDFLLMYCKNQQDLIIYHQTWEKALYFGSRGFDNASIFAANAIISNLEINDFVYRKHCTHKSITFAWQPSDLLLYVFQVFPWNYTRFPVTLSYFRCHSPAAALDRIVLIEKTIKADVNNISTAMSKNQI